MQLVHFLNEGEMSLIVKFDTGGFTEKVFSSYGSTILREEKNRRKNGLVWTLLMFESVHYEGR